MEMDSWLMTFTVNITYKEMLLIKIRRKNVDSENIKKTFTEGISGLQVTKKH